MNMDTARAPHNAGSTFLVCFLHYVCVFCLHISFSVRAQLLKEAVESQRMYELMKQQEVHLKQQVRSRPQCVNNNNKKRMICIIVCFCPVCLL